MRIVDQRLQTLLLQRAVDEWQTGRNRVIEDHATDGRVDDPTHIFLNRGAQNVLRVVFLRQIDQIALNAQLDRRLRRHFLASSASSTSSSEANTRPSPFAPVLVARQVVNAKHDVLRRNRDWLTARRTEECCCDESISTVASICASGESGM